MTDNDNTAAFDCILPALSIVQCSWLGLPKFAALFIFTFLWMIDFKVSTGHGVSANSYGMNDNPSNPGQGSGQGQGSGPMIYGASADVTLSMYGQHCTGTIFQHLAKEDPPCEGHVAQICGWCYSTTKYGWTQRPFYSFCDTVLTNGSWVYKWKPILTLVVNRNSKKWSIYCRGSGGKLNFERCFWYLLHPICRMANLIDWPPKLKTLANLTFQITKISLQPKTLNLSLMMHKGP